MKKNVVTDGADFIGSAVTHHRIKQSNHIVINIYKLTWVGNLDSLKKVDSNQRYHFERLDICPPHKVQRAIEDLIRFVQDSPGHDRRYAIDASKIRADLGWVPRETFETGLRKTVEWYLDNQAWCKRVQGRLLPARAAGVVA